MIIACQATYPWLEENVVVERKWICVLISLFEIYVRSFQEDEKKALQAIFKQSGIRLRVYRMVDWV